MKMLLDNNVPAYLSAVFDGHEVATAYQQGWHELSNGKLLDVAEGAGFKVFVTLDGGFRHQQNLTGRSIAIALLEPKGQSRTSMLVVATALLSRLHEIRAGCVLTIGAS